MKKLLISIFIVLIAVTTNFNICAAGNIHKEANEMNQSIIAVMNSQLSESEAATLKKQQYYDSSLENIATSITEYPILKKYNSAYWEFSDLSFQQKLLKINSVENNRNYCNYLVFSENPFIICKMDKADSTEIGVSASYNQVPRYIKDIQNLNSTETIDGQTREIKGIYCFDGSSSHMGTLIYLQTNKETYVKYYEYPDSEPLLFPENKFIEYGTAYYQYLISDENNYNELGESLYGGTLTFASFINNYFANNKAETKNISPITIILGVSIGIIALVSIAIIAIKVLKVKKA